jgi:hypothetical protein
VLGIRAVATVLRVVQEAAEHSGGGLTDPTHTVGDCPDWVDNYSLDLVIDVGALMLVSAGTDLIGMSGRWLGWCL